MGSSSRGLPAGMEASEYTCLLMKGSKAGTVGNQLRATNETGFCNITAVKTGSGFLTRKWPFMAARNYCR